MDTLRRILIARIILVLCLLVVAGGIYPLSESFIVWGLTMGWVLPLSAWNGAGIGRIGAAIETHA